MFRAWKENPSSVHKSWDVFFQSVEAGFPPGATFTPPPGLQPGFKASPAIPTSPSAHASAISGKAATEQLSLSHLIRAYQVRGHEVAQLDPLGLRNKSHTSMQELDYKTYGFKESDLNRSFDLSGIEGIAGFLGNEVLTKKSITLSDLLSFLQNTYCRNIGYEYMHMNSRDKCNWIREKVEKVTPVVFSKEKRTQIFDRLAYADHFERYLANKFNTAKRFGVEGAESLIPGLKALVDRVTELGVQQIVFGMPHRGRLNVLVNVIRKPMELMLKEFQGTHIDMQKYNEKIGSGDWSGSGDVKYHLGTSYDRTYPDGRKVHLALMANPSHLEAVNTVVVGKVRAKAELINDTTFDKSMAVLMHGDAAFAGQGVVYETILLSQLKNYATGGTVHVVVNNQVGFTTDPESSRSTLHCTDLGKAFDIPIFHVNADDPEAVTHVFELAGEYRQKFKSDVIIDLVGYRKHGHNELDQPSFTQPIMYAKIAKHQSALDLYATKLQALNVLTKEKVDSIIHKVDDSFVAAWERSKTYEEKEHEWLSSRWKGFNSPEQLSKIRSTGVALPVLQKVGHALVNIPSNIKLHPSLVRIMKAKEETLKAGENIDWATAEALAFGSLLLEGNHVRLSGQDVERGTFSHRHAVLHDQASNETFVPLRHVDPSQAPITICNSPLSEFGVMGFELGYSLESPNQLVLWEAQFGDFANGAQIIIDQFVSSGETKWYRQCGLTLLLPHGYEGQGPEHSSCRIERFLQAVDDQENVVPPMAEEVRMQIQQTNMQVLNCSTPANYFHALRRQIHRNFRKPLIIATPKSLLRHKSAVSTMADMADGSSFQRVIHDSSSILSSPKKIRKLIFCTGKVYYDLDKYRLDHKIGDVAIARVEQIAPFPFDLVANEVKKFPNAQIVWVQEEPRNMGAWTYVWPRMLSATRVLCGKEVMPLYAGRLAAASPAAGSTKIHDQETAKLLADAFA
jgi:2-oxoglutarate dehydrogenase E1 component